MVVNCIHKQNKLKNHQKGNASTDPFTYYTQHPFLQLFTKLLSRHAMS